MSALNSKSQQGIKTRKEEAERARSSSQGKAELCSLKSLIERKRVVLRRKLPESWTRTHPQVVGCADSQCCGREEGPWYAWRGVSR